MSADCQVDFYVLGNEQSAERFACRLAMMAWEHGHRIAVLTESAEEVRRLDELMWQHPAGRFLPHCADFLNETAPVRIGAVDAEIPADCEALINLSSKAILQPDRFKRLLEIVPASDSERTASRQKFRNYREQGLRPASHTIIETHG
jgi:DNA polymerase-3 subunit chi